jgi:hypothetical protein
MAIISNRNALKSLASLCIDAQFCQQYGAQAFHYAGEATPAYQHLCAILLQLIEQMTADLAVIKGHIPTFDVSEDRQEQA